MSKKNLERLVFGIFAIGVVAFLMIAPYVLIPQINSARNAWLSTAGADACFLELWEIDTFEGGSASRARYLEKQAFGYQNKNKQVYVIVRTVSREQALSLLSQGSRPDLISFGIGAGDIIEAMCQPINLASPIRNDLSAGGRVDGELLAAPWCMGGYVLCSERKLDSIQPDTFATIREQSERAVIGTGLAYNLPALALPQDCRKYVERKDYTQYSAYEAYLKGNEFDVLLGTQRDFFRLNNKTKLGVIDSINYQFLAGYTDLIQYLAITATDERQIAQATGFIDYVTSAEIQKKLATIGMFCVNGAKIYSEKSYQQFEEALSKKMQVLNVFVSSVWLKEEQGK